MTDGNWRIVLNVPLFSSISTRLVKQTLIARLWPTHLAQCDNVESFDAYFHYFNEECHSRLQSRHAARTVVDLVDIADHVKNNTMIPMTDLRHSLQITHPQLGNDIQKLSASIELATRLWLMINVRNLMPNDPRTLQTALPWPDTSSLEDIIQRWTLVPPAFSNTARRKFPDTLNVSDLERVTNFRIVWTDDLMNHLVLDDRVIYIYYHVSVLKRVGESVPK
jgi:hypothetical protein